jgi:hypothetical protein
MDWEGLETFLQASRIDAEWGVPPSLETLGRLTMLRTDLSSDVERLVALRADLDALIAAAAIARREADGG